MRRALLILSCAALSCTEDQVVLVPLEAAASAMVAFEHAGQVSVYGVRDPSSALREIELSEEPAWIAVLSYENTLDELMLPEGRIEPADGLAWRVLPIPVKASLDQREVSVEALPLALRDFKFPTLELAACVEREGCFDRHDATVICRAPCPELEAIPDPILPHPIERAELPQLTPCPASWMVNESADYPDTCDPLWFARVFCDEISRLHPSSPPGCERVGGTCPKGHWSEDQVADPENVFVLPGAVGGTGAIDQPFGSIAEARAVSSKIALAGGRYAEELIFDASLSLSGACAEETVLEAPNTLRHSSGALSLTALSVEAPIVVSAEGTLHLDGVRVSAPGERCVELEGGRSTIDGSLMRDCDELHVAAGAFAEITRTGFDRARLAVHGEVVLTDVSLLRDFPGASAADTYAGSSFAAERLLVESGDIDFAGTATISGVRLRRGRVWARDDISLAQLAVASSTAACSLSLRAGATLNDAVIYGGVCTRGEAHLSKTSLRGGGLEVAGGRAHVEDLVIIGAREANGIVVRDGAHLDGQRIFVTNKSEVGVAVLGPTTTATLTDLWINDVYGGEVPGVGLLVNGATAHVARANVELREGSEIYLDEGGTLRATDLDVGEDRRADTGSCMTVIHSASVAVERAHFSGAGVALYIDGAASAVLTDIYVDSDERASPTAAGILFGQNTPVLLDRAHLRGRRGLGIHVAGGNTKLRLRNVLAEGTGGALLADFDSHVTVERSLFRGWGITAAANPTVILNEVKILESLASSIERGNGLRVEGAADLSANRFFIRGSEAAGISLVEDIELGERRFRFRDGVISDNAIGLEVISPNVNLETLLERVRFSGNTRPLAL